MVPVHVIQFSLAILALLLSFASAHKFTTSIERVPFCKVVESKGEGKGQKLKVSDVSSNYFILRQTERTQVSVIFYNDTNLGYINSDNFNNSVYVVDAILKSGKTSTTNYLVNDSVCDIKEAKDWESLAGVTYYGPGEWTTAR